MSSFEKFEASVFDERDTTTGQFELELRAVARAPEKHRLRLQRDAGLTILEHLLGDISRLLGSVADRDQLGLL